MDDVDRVEAMCVQKSLYSNDFALKSPIRSFTNHSERHWVSSNKTPANPVSPLEMNWIILLSLQSVVCHDSHKNIFGVTLLSVKACKNLLSWKSDRIALYPFSMSAEGVNATGMFTLITARAEVNRYDSAFIKCLRRPRLSLWSSIQLIDYWG